MTARPRERERILGEWGVRDGNVRWRREGRALADDLDAAALKGRPLRRRLRNFHAALERAA